MIVSRPITKRDLRVIWELKSLAILSQQTSLEDKFEQLEELRHGFAQVHEMLKRKKRLKEFL